MARLSSCVPVTQMSAMTTSSFQRVSFLPLTAWSLTSLGLMSRVPGVQSQRTVPLLWLVLESEPVVEGGAYGATGLGLVLIKSDS